MELLPSMSVEQRVMRLVGEPYFMKSTVQNPERKERDRIPREEGAYRRT